MQPYQQSFGAPSGFLQGALQGASSMSFGGVQQPTPIYPPQHQQRSPPSANFAMHHHHQQQQQQPLPHPSQQHGYFPYSGHPQNYSAPPTQRYSPQQQQHHPPTMQVPSQPHLVEHQARMLQYYRAAAAAQSFEGAPKPFNPVIKPPSPQRALSSPPCDLDSLRHLSIREVAGRFNVYIPKAVVISTEVILGNPRNVCPKKVAKHLLSGIIGDDVIITQTASGGRVYKAADQNILKAVEAIVNSRFEDRESHINIYRVFNTLSNTLRERKRLEKKRSPDEKQEERPAQVAVKRPSELMAALYSAPGQGAASGYGPHHPPPQQPSQPAMHHLAWSQPVPPKRPLLQSEFPQQLQPPGPMASHFYGRPPFGHMGWPPAPQFNWGQRCVTPQNQLPPSPVSLDPSPMGSLEQGSPTKTESSCSGVLEICDDPEEEEVDDDDEAEEEVPVTTEPVGSQIRDSQQTLHYSQEYQAGPVASQNKDSQQSLHFSQEFWDYQSQQDLYYQT